MSLDQLQETFFQTIFELSNDISLILDDQVVVDQLGIDEINKTNKDLHKYTELMHLGKSTIPMLVIKSFYENFSKPNWDSIMESNADNIFNTMSSMDSLMLNQTVKKEGTSSRYNTILDVDDTVVSKYVEKISKLWPILNDSNKEKMWKYLKGLSLISKNLSEKK